MRPGPCYIKPRVKRQNKSSTGLNVRRRLTRTTLLSFFLKEPIDNSVFYTLTGILSCENMVIIYLFIYLFIMQNSFLKTFILSCMWPVP